MSGYRNPFEKRCATLLGPEYVYEPMKLPYTLKCQYLPDFVDVAGKRIVESKGLFDAADRRKMIAVKAQHPDWTIEIWFTNPEKTISKASKTTYAVWCENNGFVWKKGPSK